MWHDETGLETHMDNILKGAKFTWINYKNYLLFLQDLLNNKRPARIDKKEGSGYIRFQTITNDCNLNKMYFLFEIEDLFPRIKWRKLIRQTFNETPVILHRRTFFLPVYSFSFDRIFTLVYWGEKQFLLNPEQLELLNIKSFLFTVNPLHVILSAANFIWSRSLEKIWINSPYLFRLSKHYIFNSLFPPSFRDKFTPWCEGPFILVGDRILDIFTIHKSLCCIEPSTLRRLNNGYISYLRAASYVLDNTLKINKVDCLLPEDIFSQDTLDTRKISIVETIIIKHLRLYDKESHRRPFFEIIIFPIDTTNNLFEDEAVGPLLTLASIVLRYFYLRSRDSLRLNINLEDIKKKMQNVLSCRPFNVHECTNFASYLFKNYKGFRTLIRLLNVYYVIGKDNILYIHPSLIESLSILYQDDFEKMVTNFLSRRDSFLRTILSILDSISISSSSEKFLSFANLTTLRDNIANELGLKPDYNTIKRFVLSLAIALESIIPISKALTMPQSHILHFTPCGDDKT
jgi:hypothetical protein